MIVRYHFRFYLLPDSDIVRVETSTTNDIYFLFLYTLLLHLNIGCCLIFFPERDFTRISLRGEEFKPQEQMDRAARSNPEPSGSDLDYRIRQKLLHG